MKVKQRDIPVFVPFGIAAPIKKQLDVRIKLVIPD